MAPAEEATPTPEADAPAPQPTDAPPTESSPPEKDWKEEYARLRKDYDTKSSKLRSLEKAVKGEEEKVKPEDSELDWKLDHNDRLKLVKEEYKQELERLKSAGAKETDDIRTIALERAEQKKGVTDTSDIERQAAMSSAPGTITRMKSNPVSLSEHDRRFGITAERKAELLQKYPGLAEEI